ncbi:hypothetical protein EDD76_10320 [Kineothrix alysoides]|uniref:Membrane protein YdfK n=1 Tax=Kineothrix alysoides TaxID=1469948 RepID=A0A4R1R350_9FIRM|nr:DUF554 domain-containing protein [Kineothrix alysoides]TCL59833.1 hypothetical protein EDD76_10320 [Kineothrix alysoides]
MLGTIVNAAAIIAGAVIGIALKKGLPDRMADTLMKGVGLCTMFLGISDSLKGENSLILILSVVIGTLIGEGIDLEDKVGRLGLWVEGRVKKGEDGTVSIAEGFVTASLLFCVGAMAIVGSLQSGLMGNHEMLFGKSILDFIMAVVFSSTLGIGVAFSAGLVFLYQGSITLLAQWIAPYLTDIVVAEMTCVGSVVMIGLGMNIIGITKLRVMNYVPAIFIPIILCRFI